MNSDEWYEDRRVAMMRNDRREHVVMGANERERQQVIMINDRRGLEVMGTDDSEDILSGGSARFDDGSASDSNNKNLKVIHARH